uniref:Rhodanese domain-containing protein n=1 Tax=Tetradesmus obliquus TaxID=3088 RepID=A0A383WJ08_TETOB|eukprot:jgi/Sobl393_1/7233/SZX77455.1
MKLAPSLQARGHVQGLQRAVVSHPGVPRHRQQRLVHALSDTAKATIAPAAVPEALTEAVAAPAVTTAPELPAISLPAELPPLPDLSAASEQAAKTVSDLTGGVTSAAAGVTDKAAELASAANQATSQVTDAASKAAADLTATLSGATSGVTSKVTDLTSNLGKGASDVAGNVSSTVNSTLTTVKGGLDQVKGTVDQATAGLTGAVGSAFETVNSTTQQLTGKVNETFGSTTAAVNQTLDAANAQITAVTGQVSASVDAATQSFLAALPPPVKDAAVAVGSGVAAAAHTAVEHPRAAAVLTAAVAVPAAISYYKGRYAGYAGELSPGQVSVLLGEEANVFLVDVRPDEAREEEGLPQLKLQARFKVAAFPLLQKNDVLPPRIAREAANAEELRLLINAAYIAGLPPCQGSLTKIVVMDSTGSDKARDLARALVSLGYQLSYVMEGGFAGWAAAQLPVVEDASEYDASTGAVIGDELEVIAGKANEVVTTVAQPQVGLPLLGGGALLTYAALNYHTTLKFVGVLGVMLTIGNKLLSYDSPKDAFDDITGTLGGVAKTVSSFKPPSLPKAPKLPSMPSMPKLPGGRSSSSSSGAAAATAAAAGAPSGFAGLRAAASSGEDEKEAEEQAAASDV